ncbi:uncharacterized protein LOC126375395 [Pectinophora gossypiella]|uniref:uncharacterized protein LOC126375395 n=1 Tax=Pectinophora gossypiella TaxID=13191 RepID=UPI00214ED0CB|nr:uncharacterized protein LOC126375395 [Pectinophora gossypiella]
MRIKVSVRQNFTENLSSKYRLIEASKIYNSRITPVSPKWRSAIEARIEAERQMTIKAVGRGARLHPGHYWDVAGTFLFTIYVLTALGFGAPVPQTMWGRTATLFYAIIAVPMHFYLMLNLSTCVVVKLEDCMKRMKSCFGEKEPFEDKHDLKATKDNQAHRRNSVLMKSSPLRRRILCIVGILFCGRCVPLAILLYYVVGVIVFGVARSKDALDVVMFPLEFTTSGGLENVECYIRSLYAIYVEGAMILLSCALATLRRCSSRSMNKMTDQYRLFVDEHSKDK